MRKIILLLLLQLIVAGCFSQEIWQNEIKLISDTLISAIKQGGFQKVAITGFEMEDGNQTFLTNLFSDEIAYNLASKSFANKYKIVDRKHLDEILKEKNIPRFNKSDKKDVQKLGSASIANAIIVGEVRKFPEYYMVFITVLETENGDIFTMERRNITKTATLISKEGVNADSQPPKQNSYTPPPVAYIPPPGTNTTKEISCDNNLGDYCFRNISRKSLYVRIGDKAESDWDNKTIQETTIEPNEIGCFYDLPEKVYTIWYRPSGVFEMDETEKSKTVKIKKCVKNPKPEGLTASTKSNSPLF